MLRRTMTANIPHEPESPVSVPAESLVDELPSASAQVFRSKVYRAKEAHDWIVEPPRDMLSAMDRMVFTGPRAQHLALTYAYEKFGNARFFPY
jgi:hypothetical protein